MTTKFDREKANAVRDVKMALAKELHERTTEFGRLCNLGHVRVVEDNCPTHITVAIEDERFTDVRERFPSTRLMARIQLAIAAGRSEKNGSSITADDIKRGMQSMMSNWAREAERKYLKASNLKDVFIHDEIYSYRDEAVAQGYANVRKITATVKREPMFDLAVLPAYKLTETA